VEVKTKEGDGYGSDARSTLDEQVAYWQLKHSSAPRMAGHLTSQAGIFTQPPAFFVRV
jgi:hypothetical protein